jgi:protein transport protein SEC61 subunit alpha
MSITPEVAKPEREVKFNEKLIWTLVALVIYFIMTVTPLYGIPSTENDPFQWLRTIMASQKGTLAELGIGPIVTAGLIMQILTGSKIINVDMSDPEERALYTGAQKIMSMIMTLFEAVAYIAGGAYGPNIGTDSALLIIIQLMAAGIAIILLDEMVQKGWGLGSGISLFIAGGVASNIFWTLLAFVPADDGLPQGILFATLQIFSQDGFNFDSLVRAFLRPEYAQNSLLTLSATLVVFLIVIYFESMRIEIPVTYANYKGLKASYPVKLLYVSNIPVILASAVFADYYFISNALYNAFGKNGDNLLVNLIGTFNADNEPSGGLVLFMRPPRGLIGVNGIFGPNMMQTLPQAIIYAGILILMAVGFSMMWIETAGMGPKDVSRQLVNAGMQIPKWRRNEKVIEKRLKMYIPSAAFLGGLFIGVLAAGADFVGAVGSGVGILLCVSIMRQYFDTLVKERAAEMHPAFRQFLGVL